ncbi:tyrosine-protein phosphatase [Actinomadura parmotrematis]|uniref:Tyrosine-protein phosphatase n=1 Tax=Actinomadura parmotrematis TaxID=2864039 RepID=A0ABS7G1S1_9ACTN|nr:tyrosine-protein phosphatase [Actinomadura parmotrematis]MBW8486648.1 tyrosine-protein phosphatase [Actinomadura parmotrematis]
MQFDDEHGHIRLDGAENVRDLGGLPVAGGTVAPGRLLRADALDKLTGADLSALAPVRTVVDFRTPHEITTNGADRLPEGARYVDLPVGGGSLELFYEVIGSGDHARQQEVFGGGRTAEALIRINRDFVAEPGERAQFAAALRLVADAGSLPLLFHCTAGKDRTGWMAAIVLTALGASPDTIMADYLRSNDYHRESYAKLLGHLGESGLMKDPELLRPLLEQRPEYLEAAFDEVTARFGTFDAYLADGLAADGAALARLRDALVVTG